MGSGGFVVVQKCVELQALVKNYKVTKYGKKLQNYKILVKTSTLLPIFNSVWKETVC